VRAQISYENPTEPCVDSNSNFRPGFSQKLEALRRHVGCLNTLSLRECQTYLGLGAASGAAYLSKRVISKEISIRNPDVHLCVSENTFPSKRSFAFFWARLQPALAKPGNCLDKDKFLREQIKGDLQRNIDALKGPREAEERQIAEMLLRKELEKIQAKVGGRPDLVRYLSDVLRENSTELPLVGNPTVPKKLDSLRSRLATNGLLRSESEELEILLKRLEAARVNRLSLLGKYQGLLDKSHIMPMNELSRDLLKLEPATVELVKMRLAINNRAAGLMDTEYASGVRNTGLQGQGRSVTTPPKMGGGMLYRKSHPSKTVFQGLRGFSGVGAGSASFLDEAVSGCPATSPYLSRTNDYNCNYDYSLDENFASFLELSGIDQAKQAQQFPAICEKIKRLHQEIYGSWKAQCGGEYVQVVNSKRGIELKVLLNAEGEVQQSIYQLRNGKSINNFSVLFGANTEGQPLDFKTINIRNLPKQGENIQDYFRSSRSTSHSVHLVAEDKDPTINSSFLEAFQNSKTAMMESNSCCIDKGSRPSDQECQAYGISVAKQSTEEVSRKLIKSSIGVRTTR